MATQRAPKASVFGQELAMPATESLAADDSIEFADEEHERKVFTTPGVAEGFEELNKRIEGWKRSA